jgi:hypothetical protein
LVRTWNFYDLKTAVARTQTYKAEFGAADGGDGYFPQRFVVLADEGDYSNAASGWVWDADQQCVRRTEGGDFMDADENAGESIWDLFLDELKEIRRRIADPRDPLVSGREGDVNSRRKLPADS